MTNEINIFSSQEEPSLLEKTELPPPSVLEGLSPRESVKRTIEALLFSSNEPLTFSRLRELTESIEPLKPRFLKEIIYELKEEYASHSFQLEEVGNGYLLRTRKEFSAYIEQLKAEKRPERLSHAGTEVLAIIAYRQPITKGKIDAIRGVDSAGTLQNLMERELIQAVGKLETPGRPTLYGITQRFLDYFGLTSIEELPSPNI